MNQIIDRTTLEALAVRFTTADFAQRILLLRARAANDPHLSPASLAETLDIPDVVAHLLWNFSAATVLADHPAALDAYAMAERKAGVH